MISNETHSGTVITNANMESNFQMESSPEAFQILSSDIYEYKIAALVRELMCNAWDSHLDAGHRKPFHITFPNQLHPYFCIEDFGIGLTDDEVRHVLTVYFKSTKKKSEKSTGFLGLGAKSPLAYTDTFHVRVRKDGIENNYVCYLNEEGAPVVNGLSQAETTESNGVKFIVPVRSMDFNNFFEDARFLSSLFEVCPTSNREDFAPLYPDMRAELDSDGVYFPKEASSEASSLYQFSAGRNSWNRQNYVVMGNVAYRVSSFFLDSDSYDMDVRSYAESMMGVSTFLKVPMGSVKFTASRETLSLTDATRKAVTEMAMEYYSKKKNEVQDTIAESSDVYEAIRKAEKYAFGSQYARSWFSYRGKKLSTWANQDLTGVLELFDFRFFKKNGHNSTVFTRKIEDSFTGCSIDRSDVVESEETVIIVPREKNTGFMKYSREYARENEGSRVFSTGSPIRKSALNRLVKLLDNAKVIYVEDLRQIDLDRKKAERAALPKEDRERTKITKKQIRANAIVSWYGHNIVRKVTTYDLDSESIKECRVVYVDRTDPHVDLFRLDINGQTVAVSDHQLSSSLVKIKQVIGTEVIALIRNKTNQNKIKKNGIPHVDDLFEEVKNMFTVDGDFFKQKVRNRVEEKLSLSMCHFAMALKDAESVNYTDNIENLLKFLEKPVVSTSVSPAPWMWDHLYGDIKDEVMKYVDAIDEIKELLTVKSDYPMINEQTPVDYEVLLRYIKMEDLFRNVTSI